MTGFCIVETQSNTGHCHIRYEYDVLMKRMTFVSSDPSHVYVGFHLLEQLYCLVSLVSDSAFDFITKDMSVE
jgi:hypothetical protein